MQEIYFQEGKPPIYTCRECLKTHDVHSEITHLHQDVELVSVLSGNLRCQTGASEFELKKGDICFINRKQIHALRPLENDRSRHRVLVIGTKLLTQIPAVYEKYIRDLIEDVRFSHMRFRGRNSHAGEINALMDRIEVLTKEESSGYELELLSILYRILWLLHEAYIGEGKMDPVDGNLITVEKMTEYIYENYGEPLTLDDIAKAGNVSRSQCSKLFKEYTKMSPVALLNHHRLEKSCDFLRSTSKSVAEIAAECGYSDQSYFSRAFQKQYGTTPLEYRKAGLSGLKAG